jgi:prefoldin subunit 5
VLSLNQRAKVLIVVDLTTLNIQQLSEVKKQLDEGILSMAFIDSFLELEHLSQSFGQLRQARTKFSECIKSIDDGCRPEHEGFCYGNAPDII